MYSNQSPSQSQGKPQEQITWQGGIMIISGILALFLYQKLPKIEAWYVHYYQEIYLSLYGVFVAFAVYLLWQIEKKTKALTDHITLLAEASEDDDTIFVGTTNDDVDLHLPEAIRTGHTQIIASTGRGKTKSVILPWLCRDIYRGKSVLLIDGKGDRELIPVIEDIAHYTNPDLPVHVFDIGNPDTSCTTNPLAFGGAQQITDRIFTAFTFDDPYYKSVQYDATGSVIALLQSVEREPITFQSLYQALSDDDVLTGHLSRTADTTVAKKLTQFLQLPKRDRQEKLSGILSQLAPFATGELAPLVNGPVDGQPFCTVAEVIEPDVFETQRIFIILIPTLLYQDIGHQLGKLFLQELASAIGQRASTGRNPFLPVFLDEFSSFVYQGFGNILNKARSSGVALHLSHQSIGDLAMVSDAFANVINTNTNVKCLLGLNDPETADFFAKHIGTHTQEKHTERAKLKGPFRAEEKTGDYSIREVEAYKIHPNDLKNYTAGRGVIHFPTAKGNLTEEISFAMLDGDEFETKGRRSV